MVSLIEHFKVNSWVAATWDEYIAGIEHPACQKAKGYYHAGKYRVEMTPISNEHSQDHVIVNLAICLYATFQNIPLTGKDNCSYRQTSLREFQPDLSYYVKDNADAVPWGVGIVNLDEYPAPDLVIEISNTSLSDDLGTKRLLYEDLKIQEYWVVDSQNTQVTAFAIADGGSTRITESRVLTGLKLDVLVRAIQQSRNTNYSEVSKRLMTQFQG